MVALKEVRNSGGWKYTAGTVRVNGKEVELLVKLIPDDFDRELDSDTLARLESGEIDMALIEVEAHYKGNTGADLLGGCLIGNQDNIIDVIEDNDMVSNAVADLLNTIKSGMDLIKD